MKQMGKLRQMGRHDLPKEHSKLAESWEQAALVSICSLPLSQPLAQVFPNSRL